MRQIVVATPVATRDIFLSRPYQFIDNNVPWICLYLAYGWLCCRVLTLFSLSSVAKLRLTILNENFKPFSEVMSSDSASNTPTLLDIPRMLLPLLRNGDIDPTGLVAVNFR
jgi:hypothetical protein